MLCPNCGNEIKDGESLCSKCNTPVFSESGDGFFGNFNSKPLFEDDSESKNEWQPKSWTPKEDDTASGGFDFGIGENSSQDVQQTVVKSNNGNGNGKKKIIWTILVALLVCAAAAAVAFKASDFSKSENGTSVTSNTNEPKKKSDELPNFSTFTSQLYGINIDFPADFTMRSDPDSSVIFLAVAPDNSASMSVSAVDVLSMTLDERHKRFVEAYGGSERKINESEDLYETEMQDGSQIVHEYCIKKDNCILWFDFKFSEDESDFYDLYIERIIESLNR